MRINLFRFFSNGKKDNPSPRKPIWAWTFLISLIIAIISWVLISLEKEYAYRLPVKIHYVNLPESRIHLNTLPSYFYTETKANGFKLLSLSLKLKFNPVSLDVVSIAGTQRIQKDEEIKIPVHNFFKNAIVERSPNLTILSINPDTIFISYNKRVAKKVPVIPSLSISFSPSYDTTGAIQIIPDSVTLFGESHNLDSIHFISTQPVSLMNLSRSINKDVPLNLPSDAASEPHKVKLIIPVEQFSEKEISVSVKATNIPNGKKVVLIPSSVKFSFQTSLSNFSKSYEPEIIANFEGKENSGNGEILLKNISTHQDIRSEKITPSSIKYILLNQ